MKLKSFHNNAAGIKRAFIFLPFFPRLLGYLFIRSNRREMKPAHLAGTVRYRTVSIPHGFCRIPNSLIISLLGSRT